MTEKEVNEKVVTTFDDVKQMLASCEESVLAAARGNASAGVKARKVLRMLRTTVSSLVKLTVEDAKERRAKRKAARQTAG